MHSAVLFSLVLLGSHALAAPHAGGHRHKARDVTRTWTQGGDVYIEDIDIVTITVNRTADATATATASPTAVVKVEEKLAVPFRQKPHLQAPTPSAQPQPSPSPETTAAPAPSAPADSDSGTGTGTGPAPGPSNIDTTGSPTWSTSPNSMGKSILGTANYWRHQWDSSLGAYEWDETLANNARSTAVDPIVQGASGPENEGGANQMNHFLHQGTMAQCINEGDGTTVDSGLTPFEQAFLGWICERPNGNIPCDKIGETGHYAVDSSTGQQETGHADIIKGGYTKIGCYYQDGTDHPSFVGMWTCDFA